MRRIQFAFLLLVLAQAAHSVEEYVMRLYDVFAPARFISGLVSTDRAAGFLMINVSLVAFGVWCWAVPVRSGWPSARAFIWLWVLVEVGNGLVHPAVALAREGYFPGVLTAPLLLGVAVWLALQTGRSAALDSRIAHEAG